MRDRDRWWWAMLAVGLGFCAAGVVFALFLPRIVPSPANDPYMTSGQYWSLLTLYVIVILICLAGGALFTGLALYSRRQHLRRLAALRGEGVPLPLADITLDPALVPDVTQQPLELRWRLSGLTRYSSVPLVIVQVLLALVSIGLTVFVLVAPIFMPPQPSEQDLIDNLTPQPMSLTEIILRIAATCVVIALLAVAGFYIARALPYLFGRPFGVGVTATTAGIDAYTEWGTRVHMAWDEMRLLEASKGDTQSSRRFSLYAPGKCVSWAEYRTTLGTQHTPVGATGAEMTVRQAALLALIAARTGLTPHTLAKSLEPKPTRTLQRQRASRAAALLIFVCLLAGFTVLVYLFPVTPFAWINWPSAASLALATLSVVALIPGALLTSDALPASATPPSVGAPSLDAPGIAYSLIWRPLWQRRLLLGVLGLCLAINLVPGVWALLRQFAIYLPGLHPVFLPDDILGGVFGVLGLYFMAFALGAVGLVGLALVIASLVARTVRIRADHDGLSSGFGRHTRVMLWSSVSDISWAAGTRGLRSGYLVKGDDPTFTITWPSDPQATSAVPPGDGALPIGADELAALVAARTGKAIRVRESA